MSATSIGNARESLRDDVPHKDPNSPPEVPDFSLVLGGPVFESKMNASLKHRNTPVFEFAKALVHQNGPALVGCSVKYDYA